MSARYWTNLGMAAGAALHCSCAEAADKIVLCQSPEKSDITIRFNDQEFEGKPLNCIGGEFVVDVSPCAPEGGYALASPTGAPVIVGVVDDWRDYGDHLGGVTSHWTTPDVVYFEGGFMGDSYEENWSFKVSRLTGVGELVLAEDQGDEGGRFECASAQQLF